MAKDSKTGLHIHYEYPLYEEFIQPEGALTRDRACHACFHYTKLAMRARALHAGGIENQIIQVRVGDEDQSAWHESRDEEIARGVALMYGLESPDEFLKYRKEAWAQAALNLGLPVDIEIYNVRPGARRLH